MIHSDEKAVNAPYVGSEVFGISAHNYIITCLDTQKERKRKRLYSPLFMSFKHPGYANTPSSYCMCFFFSIYEFDVDQKLSKMLKCITVTDQSHGSLLFNSHILVRSFSVHLTLKAWRPVTVICLTHSSRRPFCIWIALWIKALSKGCLVSGSGDTVACCDERGKILAYGWWNRYRDGWVAWVSLWPPDVSGDEWLVG